MLPLKCLSYDRIGHFSSKCPYGKEESSKKEFDTRKMKEFYPKRKNFGKKKNLYINKQSEVSDASDCSEEDQGHGLVMRDDRR